MRHLKKVLSLLIIVMALLVGSVTVWAADKILFIPHDNRPISAAETAEVVQKAGYEVVMPPADMLCGGVNQAGDTEALWQWTQENIAGAKAAMISADSMIYGGLVPSRKHEVPLDTLLKRAERLATLQQANPRLKMYIFGSLMRTPRSGAHAGAEEPDYYLQYGADIFRRSALLDKAEMQSLSSGEKQELAVLEKAIPEKYLTDWQTRREKNITVSRKLIDMTREGRISYLVIGKDDNAPLSQTHREARELQGHAAGLPTTKFQLLAGIDEFGLLLLTRAVNDLEKVIPFVYTEYAPGKGYDTVPNFSDAKIGDSVKAAIQVAGAMPVTDPAKADLVFLVSTNKNGATGDGKAPATDSRIPSNDGRPRHNTQAMIQRVNDYVYLGYPLALADISFANGADDALMQGLQQGNLLYRLRGYAGWNTATNSAGFALAMGLLSRRISDDDCDKLLTRRYLEDWGYQTIVRTKVGDTLYGFRQSDVYSNLGSREGAVTARIQQGIRDFAMYNLPPFAGLDAVKVTLPWHRMFEADFSW